MPLCTVGVVGRTNKSSAEFWAKYVDVDMPSLELPADILTTAASVREVALEFLAKKAGAPLEALRINARFTTAVTSYDTVKAAVTAANKAIQTTNDAIAAKKVAIGVADLKAEEAELARLKACMVRHMPAVATLCDAHLALVAAKDLIEKQKDAARAAPSDILTLQSKGHLNLVATSAFGEERKFPRISMSALCHVWTAPGWQEKSSRRRLGRCSHVFGL
jgi:hypothetical protein